MIFIKNTRNRTTDTYGSFEEFKHYLIGGYETLFDDNEISGSWDEIREVIQGIDYAENIADINRAIQGIEDYSDMYEEA